jgi:WD40 repeat protein
LVTAGDDWTVRLWSLRDAAELQTFRFSDSVYGVAASSDGAQILAGGKDGFLATWDLHSRQQTARFRADLTTVQKVASGPDGRFGAAGYPSLAFVWRTGDEPPPPEPEPVDEAVDEVATTAAEAAP